MATVFVVVADQHGTNARNFYQMFPAESVLPNQEILTIDRVDRVSSPSLNTLLQAIARRRDRDIVVVSHGSPTQLAIPVMRRIRIGLDLNFINAILGSTSDANLARRLHTNTRNVRTLRSRIRQVQRLGIRRLEFRACRVGQSLPTLEGFKRLFGATTACGPQAFDGYGIIQGTRPTTNSASLTQWQTAHPGYQSFGTSPDRFFWVNSGSVDPPVISSVFAESWGGVRAWAEAKFPSGTSHNFRQGTLYYHMQTTMLASSSTVHGRRTFNSSFVFPNDTGYRQNLVQTRAPAGTHSAPAPASAPKARGPLGLNSRYAASHISNKEPTLSPQQGQHRVPGPERLVI